MAALRHAGEGWEISGMDGSVTVQGPLEDELTTKEKSTSNQETFGSPSGSRRVII